VHFPVYRATAGKTSLRPRISPESCWGFRVAAMQAAYRDYIPTTTTPPAAATDDDDTSPPPDTQNHKNVRLYREEFYGSNYYLPLVCAAETTARCREFVTAMTRPHKHFSAAAGNCSGDFTTQQ